MLKQFLTEEDGQTTVEYLLIIAVIVVVISVFGKVAQERMAETVNTVFKGVNARINDLMSKAGGQ